MAKNGPPGGKPARRTKSGGSRLPRVVLAAWLVNRLVVVVLIAKAIVATAFLAIPALFFAIPAVSGAIWIIAALLWCLALLSLCLDRWCRHRLDRSRPPAPPEFALWDNWLDRRATLGRKP
ncbi:MAG: hypothetical protein U0790_05395 [Isosphaeraceae bacterium]